MGWPQRWSTRSAGSVETRMGEVALSLRWAGSCRHPEAMVLKGASWRPALFPALFGILRHPRHGVTLFDTGYSARFQRATEPFPQRLYRWLTPVRVALGDSAAEQLLRAGIAPESVARIVLSHFHADHIAGARDFPNARFVASRAAWDAVRGRGTIRSTALGFLPRLLPDDFEARATLLEAYEFRTPGIGQFETSHDLFGDGSVRLIPLPRHARGQLGWLAQTAGRRRFLISRHTVTSHIKNAYRKLDVHTAAAAVFRAMNQGLLGKRAIRP
ncbi:MAG: MBL fold metallo-hydrolase [Betaproteobacteria bacterium]|nr:MAG: MBL fold metallo-hydrolase [Betaproteobacteria bacterium]